MKIRIFLTISAALLGISFLIVSTVTITMNTPNKEPTKFARPYPTETRVGRLIPLGEKPGGTKTSSPTPTPACDGPIPPWQYLPSEGIPLKTDPNYLFKGSEGKFWIVHKNGDGTERIVFEEIVPLDRFRHYRMDNPSVDFYLGNCGGQLWILFIEEETPTPDTTPFPLPKNWDQQLG